MTDHTFARALIFPSVVAEKWTLVNPVPGAITCNLGDSLQYWSDDVLKATYPRVRVPTAALGDWMGDRHSIAYFANARMSTVLTGADSTKYPAITFADVLERLKKTAPPVNEDGFIPPDVLAAFNQHASGPEFAASGQRKTG